MDNASLIYDEDTKVAIKRRTNLREKVRNYECRHNLSRCELPRRFRGWRLPLIVAIDVMWLIVLWGGVVGKLINDSMAEYLKHYTNWNWTANAVYYLFDLIFILRANRFCEFILLTTFFWMLTCNNWFVFTLVFPMLISNPGTITDNFKENGGDFSPGVVFVADRIFHVMTIVFWFIYFALRIIDFIEIYYILFAEKWNKRHENPWDLSSYGIIWYIILMAIYSPLFFFVYYNCFDFLMVYQVSTPIWAGIIIIVSLTILSVVYPIIFLSPIIKYNQKNVKTKSWVLDEYNPSPEDVKHYIKHHKKID